MPTRIGVSLAPQHVEWREIRAAAERAEDAGVDTLFTWDHFFPLHGDPDGKHFECWTLLAAMAEVTQGVRFGPLVSAISYRNPNLLADMARTVDHISGGRLILGIGAGWFAKDYRRYGYRFADAPGRLRELGTALPVIEERLGKLNPPPIQRPIPIMIGGGGEKVTLRLTARHAHIWNGFGPPDRFNHKCNVLDRWCQKEGRDPQAIERSVLISAREVDRAEDYFRAGATHLIVEADGPAYDLAPVTDLVAWRDELNR